MTQHPYAVHPDTPVPEIMQALLARNLNAAIVTDDSGAVLGMISEGDLIRRHDSAHTARRDHWLSLLAEGEPLSPHFLQSLQLEQRAAREVMSAPAICVSEDTDLTCIADLLVRHRIKRVPVTRGGRLVGVVGSRDLLEALLAQGELT